MQTDGWPEVDEVKQFDLINEQDIQQAKAVILNWVKDLRAQPEVGSSPAFIPSEADLTAGNKLFYLYFICINHLAAKCVAWRTCGKGSAGPAVSLALGPCAQSGDCYGAGYVDFNGTEAR